MPFNKIFSLLNTAGILLFIYSTVTAQNVDYRTISNKLRIAQELERSERLEEAKILYETLYRQAPDNIVIFNHLKDFYLRIQAYEQALEFLEERRKKKPNDPNLEIYIAQIYYNMGKKEEAMTRWNSVLDRYPKDSSIYHSVANTMIKEKLFDEAIDVYKLGRRRIGRDDLYVFNLANLYASRMNYGETANELLGYLKKYPKQASIVEGYLLKYAKSSDAIREVEKKLKETISSDTKNMDLRQILVRFYINAGRYREGLKVTREIEQLTREKQQGEALFRFGQKAFQSGASNQAIEAYTEIRENYPNFLKGDQVLFGLAQCYEAQGKFLDAATAYQKVFDEFKQSRLINLSLYKKGLIERDELIDLSSAVNTFQTLIKQSPLSKESADGQLELGTCFIVSGDLDQAETIFRKVLKNTQKKKDRKWVKAQIRLADVAYLKRQFEESISLLDEITKVKREPDVTENPELNDGLKLRVFLQEHFQRSPEALNLFAIGEMWEKQRKYKNAIKALDSLLFMWPHDPITVETFFKRGEIEIKMNLLRESLASFDTLVARFPTSLLADQAVERTGWIYEKLGDQRKALKQYEILLVSYPQSFLRDEVRRRIRSIEKEKL